MKKITIVCMLGIVVPCTAYSMPNIYTKWQRHIVQKINKNGPQSLNTLEKATIYSFAACMAAGGLAHGYPEVAKEQIYMLWEGKNKRSFESDFAMQAPEIQRAAIKFAKKVRNKKNKSLSMSPRHIKLKYGKTPYRVILALNPPTMSAKAVYNKNKKDWKITYKVTVPVKYSKSYRNKIPTALGNIVIHQKIFWALQESGWLHTYDAEWTWNVMAKDLADS
jgi:hypothetical protein